jgi:hypothetical protein
VSVLAEPDARTVVRGLSGYLCGTTSQLVGRSKRKDPNFLARAHELIGSVSTATNSLGMARWMPEGALGALRTRLAYLLDRPGVVDLVVFGSASRGSMTGFSDLDAILVVSDETADDRDALERLRPFVLSAQRGVLSYQPMQHHGFLVTTPRLLTHGLEPLDLPRQALAGSRSLLGRPIRAASAKVEFDARRQFLQIAGAVTKLRRWPTRACEAHLRISLFELLPALFCQASGRAVEKHESFALSREELPADWRPYDVLQTVRRLWPRTPSRTLAALMKATKNPWVAHAVWRRRPSATVPPAVASLLTQDLLESLNRLTMAMTARVAP